MTIEQQYARIRRARRNLLGNRALAAMIPGWVNGVHPDVVRLAVALWGRRRG